MTDAPGITVINVELDKSLEQKLLRECGGHRIQRIPPTERKGRVHTSTVTVAVIDDAQQIESIRDEDLKVEWYSGSGAGGQHRNKHQNSCRLTHLVTGLVATCSTRSRISSYEGAREVLSRRISERQSKLQDHAHNNNRIRQIGTGMRGDKIRTYRFQDDTVTDHRSNKTASTRKVLKGNFDLLW